MKDIGDLIYTSAIASAAAIADTLSASDAIAFYVRMQADPTLTESTRQWATTERDKLARELQRDVWGKGERP